jgi:ribosomal protein S21
MKDQITYNGKKYQRVNEASMELKKLEDAIKMFQKKIKKQGRVTNARDEDHLENLIKIYKQMGGKKIKESVSVPYRRSGNTPNTVEKNI